MTESQDAEPTTDADSASKNPVEFVSRDLRRARFRACDLSGAVLRGVEISGAEIDSPWLLEREGGTLIVNGVDVAPYVDAELNKRFPGRELKGATTPADLRLAWSAVESAWSGAVQRARAEPPGTVEESVDGEWSFIQTVRHLIMATDTWFRGAILEIPDPFDPAGLPNTEYELDGNDPSVFVDTDPDFDTVLTARAEHQAMVRDYLATVTDGDLTGVRRNFWAPQYSETVLSCLHTIIEEEWEHLRYATRDLDALERRNQAEPAT